MQLRLAGSFRDAKRARGFRMAKPVNADQHEHVPRPIGQRGDGALNVERRRAGGGIGPVGQALRGFGNLVFGPQALAPRLTRN